MLRDPGSVDLKQMSIYATSFGHPKQGGQGWFQVVIFTHEILSARIDLRQQSNYNVDIDASVGFHTFPYSIAHLVQK